MKKFKKILLFGLVLLIALSAAACASQEKDDGGSSADQTGDSGDSDKPAELEKIVIGASPTPHAEILQVITDDLKAQGYELDIVEFTDYVQPNLALDDGSLDANYFQHLPYLEDFNAENDTALVSAGAIHYEPFGLYPGKTTTLDELKAKQGALIAVPNDTTNEARALLLLEAQGLITLNPDAGLKATINDITDNPGNIEIKEIEAAQIPRSLQDVDAAVINGNFALDAGLKVDTDALATEDKDSLAATTFGNIIAVREGEENSDKTKALIAALKSDKVKTFILNTYEGAVVPIF